jgi:hypothetical protein
MYKDQVMREIKSVLGDYNSNFTLQHIDTFNDYYPYMGHTTLEIRVSVSSLFSGNDDFYLTTEKINSVVETLTMMHQDLQGKCEIKNMDSDSDAYFTIEMEKYGHLSIIGQLGSTWQDEYMKFRVDSDQTILPRLVQILTDMVNESA